MQDIYRKLSDLLDPQERRRTLLLILLLVPVAAAELVGLSAVLVLLRGLSDPAWISTAPATSWLPGFLGVDDPFTLQLALALGTTGLVALGISVRAAGAYLLIRHAELRGHSIALRLLGTYLAQPYVWFLSHNGAELARSVLNDTLEVVSVVLRPAMQLLSSGIVALVIVVFLVVLDPLIALAAAGLIGGVYTALYLVLRQRLLGFGQQILDSNTQRFRSVHEAFGGFKEVKLLGLEGGFAQRFGAASLQRALTSARASVVGDMPRFALEAMTFVVLVGAVLLLLFRSGGTMDAAIPTLGVFAFATMRLLPSLQQIYHGMATIRRGLPVLDRLHGDYVRAVASGQPDAPAGSDRLPMTDSIVLDRVSFAYPNARRTALKDLSMTIPARSTIGIVGGTGAGKTTLVDLILGLLRPDAGELRIDGAALQAGKLRAWQRNIGYVPQAIYLTDHSVTHNIAFGVAPEEVDHAAVERAARMAALHDFVISELPQGYATVVGERGVRLSGGQRQRVGIARALYHDPDVLVFDEATSALDTLTERVVMQAVQSLRKEKTVILIAHRLGTVRNCDVIHLLDHGRIAASGTFDELVEGSETFRRMAAGA